MNAVFFSFVRDAGAFPVLLFAARLTEGAWVLPRSGRELRLFAVLGLTGMFGGQLCYILGVYYAGADVTSIVQPAMPVWTSLFVVLAGVEPVPPPCRAWGALKIGGIALAAAGAVVMVVGKNGGASHDTASAQPLLGTLLAVGNTVLFGVYMTLQKKHVFVRTGFAHRRFGARPTYVTAWSYGFGSLFMAVGAAVGYWARAAFLGFGVEDGRCVVDGDCPTAPGHAANQSSVNGTNLYRCDDGACIMTTDNLHIPEGSIVPLVYAIFLSSAMCYAFITFANRNADASVVTAFWPLQVLAAVLLAKPLLPAESVSHLQYGGGAMIIAGLFSIVGSNVLHEREAAAGSK